MKTLKERVTEALNNFEFNKENSDINALIAYAYYLGKCTGVKEVCDTAKEIFSEQQKRCEGVRYHKLAEKIQGGKSYIYHSDYDGWINEFDNDKTDL